MSLHGHVTLPSRAVSTFGLCTTWTLDQETAGRPLVRGVWSEYESAEARAEGADPLRRTKFVIPVDATVASLIGNQAAYGTVAAETDAWVRDHFGWTAENVQNPDFDNTRSAGPDNPAEVTVMVPGPWADAEVR